MALSVEVSVVGKFTPKNGLGTTIKLFALKLELTVTVENEVRGVAEGVKRTLRFVPPLEVIVGEPIDSI